MFESDYTFNKFTMVKEPLAVLDATRYVEGKIVKHKTIV